MLYIAPSIILADTVGSLLCPAFLWRTVVTAVTADEEDADFPASNLLNPQTSSLWKSGSTADQDLVFDLDPTEPINAFGIARHNFGSGHVGVTVSGMTAEPGAVFETLAELSPGDDSPIFGIVEGDYYVQLKISLEPDTVEPQAAVAYVGTALLMPRSTPAGFVLPKDGLERDMLSGVAENGDFLADIVRSERLATSIDFKLLEGAWYRESMREFVQSTEPFFYAYSPTLLPDEMAFAKFNGAVAKGQVNQFTGEVDVSIPIVGLAL